MVYKKIQHTKTVINIMVYKKYNIQTNTPKMMLKILKNSNKYGL